MHCGWAGISASTTAQPSCGWCRPSSLSKQNNAATASCCCAGQPEKPPTEISAGQAGDCASWFVLSWKAPSGAIREGNMFKPFIRCLLVLACMLPALVMTQQQTAEIDIPAGSLVTALDTLARQTGVQFVYSADQLTGLTTRGARGNLSAQEALADLLAGTGYSAHRDASGAVVIVKDAAKPPAPAASSPTSRSEPAPKTLQEVVVTGSRIPRSQIEGPAPVVAITAQDIQRRGFASVPDLMTSLTQNLGALDNNQYTDGFSPGAQAVDLRGLGPNHTLVLVNGRRIADYPQSYGGNSNFTDISNIPTALIDRVEILSGSASAVYGS